MKKIGAILIVLIVVVIAGVYIITDTTERTVMYDEHFNITLPDSFEVTEKQGLIYEVYPENKSYVIAMSEEEGLNSSSIEDTFKEVESYSNLSEFKEHYANVTSYNLGANKVYEFTILNSSDIKNMTDMDAQIGRLISFVVPGSEKVYSIFIGSNDTSVDLNNADIQKILNSTDQIEDA